jgi:ferredoxin
VPGIYVAGDLGGAQEATIAIEEGRLAGLSAAESLGYAPKDKKHLKAEIISRLAELRYVGVKTGIGSASPLNRMVPECQPGRTERSMNNATSIDSGPQIMIECPEEIPCNPCEEACPRGAIEVGSPITNLPHFRKSLCTGCGLCIAACPAQAIFLIDRSFSEDYARLDLPYEELPRPRKQEIVGLLDRQGKKIGKGKVIRTRLTRAYDKTAVVSVAAPQEIADGIRYIDTRD